MTPITRFTDADKRGIAAALAFTARNHPNADQAGLRALAAKLGYLAYFDAVLAPRAGLTNERNP